MKTAAADTSRQVRRRTFSAQVFGLSTDNSVGLLKGLLHVEGLTKSSTDKLDLVMVEDFDHLTDLVSTHGIPLARDGIYTGPTRAVITLPWYTGALAAATVLLALCHELIDFGWLFG